MRRRTVAAVALLGLAVPFGARPAGHEAAGDPPAGAARPDEVLAYFTTGVAPKLHLRLDPAEYATLEKEPREYVHATMQEGDKKIYEDIGVHLKGFYGSWRTLDQKPGFSVRLDKFTKGQKFHGLAKLNLNNSVSDASYFNEFVGSEVYRAAGMAATLAAHAHVWINDRDVGVYVLKEGFDKHFLERNFADPEGNLYDGGGANDVNDELEKDSGGKTAKVGSRPAQKSLSPDGEDRSDLQALYAACKEEDPVKRREEMSKTLDMDKFVTFAALERMLCHTDGYCMNRNNYRLYFPKDGKGVFIPHGMDFLLADAKVPLFDEPASIVARALWSDAAWQVAYRARMKELLPLFTQPEWLFRRIDAEMKRTQPVAGGAAGGGPQAGEIKARFARRAKNLVEQIAQPAPKPLDLDKGDSFRVANWRPVAEAGGPKLTQTTLGAERVLKLEAGPPPNASVGSWQTRVLLAPGKYRFEGIGQVDGLVASGSEGKGGASLHVPGGTDSPRLEGTGGWKPLAVEFTVVEPRKVELSIEIRATAGAAFFRLGALKLVRVE